MKTENNPDLVRFGQPLPIEVETFLRFSNPWWQGELLVSPPPFRRWMFEPALKRLKKGMTPGTVLRGTRQVGKTTLQEQIIDHLLNEEGVSPDRILRVQFDQMPLLNNIQVPVLALSLWFEKNILNGTFHESARKGEPVYIFFDEVQSLSDWSTQIKVLVDHRPVRLLLTGSSAFSIERGRDSLAGRILTMDVNTLSLREIAALRGWGDLPPLLPFNGIAPLKEQTFWQELREHGKRHREVRDNAFAAFSERGGYPLAQVRPDMTWEEVANYLNQTIIRRVIQHDLGVERNKHLLEGIFQLACRYAGQAPGKAVLLGELQASLSSQTSWEDVLTHMQLLNDSLLIRLISPLEIRLKRQKGNAPKICLADHSLRASWLQEQVPLTPEGLQNAPHLGHLAGGLAESIAGYFFSSFLPQTVTWFPARKSDPEVDLVITVGQYRIPIEVKYRRKINEERDTKNLRAFLDKKVYNAPFGILLTMTDDVSLTDPRMVALPLSSLLLMR